MNTLTKAVVMVIFAISITGTVNAGSKERLVNSIKKQIRGQESQIVSMWMAGRRNKELDKVLADYIVKNIRLQAMGGTPTSIYAKVSKNGKEYKTTISLAKAIVLEHFRKKGINLGAMEFVQGKYSLKLAAK